jgi:hypothetical protein
MGPGPASVHLRAMRLRSVLNDRDAQLGREPTDLRDWGQGAVEVDHQYRAGLAAHGVAYPPCREAQGVWIDVGQDRNGADVADRRRAGNPGQSRHDHLVARPDIESLQSDRERRGPAPAGDPEGGAAIGGKGRREASFVRKAAIGMAAQRPFGRVQDVEQIALGGRIGPGPFRPLPAAHRRSAQQRQPRLHLPLPSL